MFIGKKKILVYPFTYKDFPLVKLLSKSVKNITIATEEGTGLVGKDIGFSVNRGYCNIPVLKYSERILQESNVLFIPEGNIKDPINERIIEVLQKSINNNKKIISSLKLDSKNLHYLKYNKYIDLLNQTDSKLDLYFSRVKENQLAYFVPKIPVIYVGGVFDIIDNHYIAISLKQKLEEEGYKVCCITNESYGKVFNCLTFPDDFMNNRLSIEDRILDLNNYIRASIEFKKPDLMIIQIPFGMLRYNEYYENSFGSYAYMISQAIKSDYFVCTSTSEIIYSEYFEELSNYFERLYFSPIDSLHISNCQFNIPMDSRASKLSILFRDESEINDEIKRIRKKSSFGVFNLYKENDLEELFKDIINKLG